jgi:hypothetical protein
MLEWKRRIARVVAVLSIALAAGHLVQTKAAKDQARHSLEQRPEAIEQVAAGPETSAPRPVQPALIAMPKVPLAVLAPPVMPQPVLAAPSAADAAPQTAAPDQVCAARLDLVAQPAAMIGLALAAPCHVEERVVVQHAGLTFSTLTSATGDLSLTLPALAADAQVAVVFADGSRTSGHVALPDLAGMRRFAIQWQGADAFLLHGFEGGAGYGTPGDVWAENTRAPSALLPAGQGYMTLLGDPAAPAPLLAAIYTYPADTSVRADIVIEAAIDAATCGRELLGQTLASAGGRVHLEDLAVTMPECDATGGYLVLKNLAPETNIAAAD